MDIVKLTMKLKIAFFQRLIISDKKNYANDCLHQSVKNSVELL